jgi:hypothetical protein
MSFQQVKRCLDILKEYPAIENYIKEFNGRDGFSFTIETDKNKLYIQRKMNELLDDGSHSGGSWAYMLRTIQAILNGTLPYEEYLEKEKSRYMKYI